MTRAVAMLPPVFPSVTQKSARLEIPTAPAGFHHGLAHRSLPGPRRSASCRANVAEEFGDFFLQYLRLPREPSA
jgi:hypothetical protein